LKHNDDIPADPSEQSSQKHPITFVESSIEKNIEASLGKKIEHRITEDFLGHDDSLVETPTSPEPEANTTSQAELAIENSLVNRLEKKVESKIEKEIEADLESKLLVKMENKLKARIGHLHLNE